MNFRGPAHKPIAPGLLSDPAFSSDPLSHPYHDLAWSTPPPVGHPVIKKKNPRTADPDAEFWLIQPPNSPVSDIATQDYPQFPFHSHPAASSSPSVTKPQPPAKQRRKFRMPFLTRRKTTQPQPTDKSPSIPKMAQAQPAPQPTDDVTQPPRPAAALRRASSERAAFTSTSGTNTPRSTAPSSTTSAVSKRLVEGVSARNHDLDRIDELDETSPWGISLHHGGPYEAAVQAIRRSDHRMPLGILNGGGHANEYHKRAMLAHGNVYVPPQVPTGVSLKLSPGQILPRDFNDRRRIIRPPRLQNPQLQRELSVNISPDPQIFSSPLPIADYQPSSQVETRSLQREPLISRRQSQAQPPQSILVESRTYDDRSALSSQASSPTPPLPTPHPALSTDTKPDTDTETLIARNQWPPMTSLSLTLSAPSTQAQLHNPAPNPVIDDSPLNIGMAMLEPELPVVDVTSISAPENYLHTGVPDKVQEFDPYDPIHMKNEHSRTPSPLDSTPQDNSLEPSPESLLRAADLQDPPKAHDNLIVSAERPISQAPPPYSSIPAESEIRHQPSPVHQVSGISQAQSRIHTPEPTPSIKSNGPARSNESGQSSYGFRGSHDSLPSENPSVIQPQRQESPQDTQPMLPTRPERNRVQPQPLAPSNQDRERDGKSTNYSISTHSSGQNRRSLQPPPHRHLPKRLVMPAPLNNNGVVLSSQQRVYQSPPPAARFPQQMQVQFRPQSQQSLSPSDPLLLPPILGNSRPLEPQITASRKLKKRVSLITPASDSTPPIITTVSFAPPVIGFQPHEKMTMHSKSEKVPKRVLSKRRTDL